ncbi:MAG: outer membrane protein assembly factor [Bacteroidales bacterium]|nr:outer membrane protein assembly factor [Bacteroidales bacterium]
MHKPHSIIPAILLLLSGFLATQSHAQATADTLEDGEKIKKGWSFGALPAVSYDTDLGFKYGGLIDLYHYGDGSYYPGYKHKIYLEWSRTTKGSGINQVFYDSKYLLPGSLRLTADISYLTEQALDFYGFNGYEAIYNSDLEEDESNEYISRMFYRHERKLLRVTADVQGSIIGQRLRWLAGFGHYGNSIAPVDIDKLNEGKDEKDKLPYADGLYERYLDWGVIDDDEADGGQTNFLKFGLIYDTRDNEAAPQKGIWSELLFVAAPGVFGNDENPYGKVAFTHRQYFQLIKKQLVFAYRLGFQGTFAGDPPFYMQPQMISSYAPSTDNDGLGGSKTLRGILRNRVVGDAIAYGNFEFRWKFFKTVIFNQNIYVALNTFLDAGKVMHEHEVDLTKVPVNKRRMYFSPGAESWHASYGAGMRFALNQNFILAIDYGRSFDHRDGVDGFYTGMNYLF